MCFAVELVRCVSVIMYVTLQGEDDDEVRDDDDDDDDDEDDDETTDEDEVQDLSPADGAADDNAADGNSLTLAFCFAWFKSFFSNY